MHVCVLKTDSKKPASIPYYVLMLKYNKLANQTQCFSMSAAMWHGGKNSS